MRRFLFTFVGLEQLSTTFFRDTLLFCLPRTGCFIIQPRAFDHFLLENILPTGVIVLKPYVFIFRHNAAQILRVLEP